jgi:hypothetical protein
MPTVAIRDEHGLEKVLVEEGAQLDCDHFDDQPPSDRQLVRRHREEGLGLLALLAGAPDARCRVLEQRLQGTVV